MTSFLLLTDCSQPANCRQRLMTERGVKKRTVKTFWQMLAVYKSLALAQTAQIWQSVKKSQVARTRANAKHLDTKRCQNGWAGRAAEVETYWENRSMPSTVSPYDATCMSNPSMITGFLRAKQIHTDLTINIRLNSERYPKRRKQ